MKKLNHSKLLSDSKKFAVALGVFVSRLGVLPGNISPLGSFGFFGGNPLLYFAGIFAFDFFVGGTYRGNWLTYLGFAAYPTFGFIASRFFAKNLKAQALLLPIASFSFFILSNLGAYLYWYPQTIEGLLLCYTLALPFYTRTLIGDLGFGYGYLVLKSLLLNRKVKLAVQPASL